MKQKIDDLKQGFTWVKVKHYNTPEYKATHVALVKDGEVFVGIARANPNDQFSRAIGREVALGRAMHVWKVHVGIIQERARALALGRKTAYVRKYETVEELEKILQEEVFSGEAVLSPL